MEIKKGFTIIEIAVVLVIISLLGYYSMYLFPKISEAERRVESREVVTELNDRLLEYIRTTRTIPGRVSGNPNTTVTSVMDDNVSTILGFDTSAFMYMTNRVGAVGACSNATTFNLALFDTDTRDIMRYQVYYAIIPYSGAGTMTMSYQRDGSGIITGVTVSAPMPPRSINVRFATAEDMKAICDAGPGNLLDKVISPSGAVGTADLSSTSSSYAPLNLVKGDLTIYNTRRPYVWYTPGEEAANYRYCVKMISPDPNIPFEGQIHLRTVGDRPGAPATRFMGFFGYLSSINQLFYDGMQSMDRQNFVVSEMLKIYNNDHCTRDEDFLPFNNVAPGIVTVDMQYQDMSVFMLYIRDGSSEVKVPIVTHYNYYDTRSICYYMYQLIPNGNQYDRFANFIVPCVPAGRIFENTPGSLNTPGVPILPIWRPEYQRYIDLQ